MKRAQLINLHLILATMLLPAIAMFAITGGFYTWGIKGGYDSQTYKLPLAMPLNGDLASLISFTQQELDKQQQAYPSGAAKFKSTTHNYTLEWSGSDSDISLSTAIGSKLANLEVKKTSAYRQFVQLHKAKGGYAFKIYAALMALGLLVILISGVFMGLGIPKYRLTTGLGLLAGISLWIGVISIS
ncbi:MAG: hypothetical protein ACI8SR_002656 [Oceanicoccus sp.]|jgi:hypothetical protein